MPIMRPIGVLALVRESRLSLELTSTLHCERKTLGDRFCLAAAVSINRKRSISSAIQTLPPVAATVARFQIPNVAVFQHVSFAHRMTWGRVLRVELDPTDCRKFDTGELK